MGRCYLILQYVYLFQHFEYVLTNFWIFLFYLVIGGVYIFVEVSFYVIITSS